jgi:drug/metabolite transporter (DMT)-like permease
MGAFKKRTAPAGLERRPDKLHLFINFVPLSAILLAFIFPGEPLTNSLLVGTLLVTSGVYLTNRP